MKVHLRISRKEWILIGFFALLPVFLVAGVNALIGSPPLDLVFPAGSEMLYETFEFKSHAQANNLGFRDREFSLKSPSKHRIVAFGDSFTFGWGVAMEEAWPKILEAKLHDAGIDVEVANLGKPGGSPYDYADVAERAIPALKPDLVLVGILQGDDLIQLGKSPETFQDTKPYFVLRKFINFFVGNIRRSVQRRKLASAAEKGVSLVREDWKKCAGAILSQLEERYRPRWDQLDETAKKYFLTGELNPSLILDVLTAPRDNMASILDLKAPQTLELISLMGSQLRRIEKVAHENGARIQVLSVPLGTFTSKEIYRTWGVRYGGTVYDHMLKGDGQDESIRRAAELAKLPTATATARFRREDGGKVPLFYTYDGHFTPRGHALFAEEIAPRVASLLK